MDLQDQLKNLFPDHEVSEQDHIDSSNSTDEIPIQEAALICKYEKRKGKPTTLIEGFLGTDAEFKNLAKKLKKELSVGGSVKNGSLIMQGDFREKIMQLLVNMGFKVKRVGG